MPRVNINSIFGGLSPSINFASEGQHSASVSIDPDLPMSDAVGDRQTSGVIRPSAYAKFSGANVTASPVAILTTPKTALVYTVLSNGRLISYNSSLASETLIGTVTGGVANGAVYYNNYIYIFTGTDVSRYGPLDGAASLTNTFWTSTLGKTALVNTAYPSLRGGGTYPNHWAHVHVDGSLYFLDYDSTSGTVATRGKGLVHRISTKYGSAEGDTNDNSAYNVLDLPPGFMPTCLASYGTQLVFGAIQTNSATLSQGRASLFFWDTVSSSFVLPVWLPDPLVTALLNNNGTLHIWSGMVSNGTDVSNGYRMSRYLGGQQIQAEYFSETGSSPTAGAVTSFGDRILWGTFQQLPTTTGSAPEYYASVMALGSKDFRFPLGVHSVIKSSATATAGDGLVTALACVQQASFSNPRFVIGFRDSTSFGLDSASTTYGTWIWRSQTIMTGSKATIKRIRVPLGRAVASNITITPKLFLDDFSSSSTNGLTVINNTNYAAGERYATWYPAQVVDHSFILELRGSGTVLCPVLLPVTIDFDIQQD